LLVNHIKSHTAPSSVHSQPAHCDAVSTLTEFQVIEAALRRISPNTTA